MNDVRKTIAVFAYDFPHRKTQEFLTHLYLHDYGHDVVVLAAPFKKLDLGTVNLPQTAKINHIKPVDTKELCEKFGFSYYAVDHDDALEIAKIVEDHHLEIAFIAGARILKAPVIDLFATGVVNFHPGPLPETAGLDSFHYAIKNDSYPGITAHFINTKVDEGALIEFFQLDVMPHDSFEIMEENLFTLQISAFQSLLTKGLEFQSVPINRPFKNQPMTLEEKEQVVAGFGAWRDKLVRKQGLIAAVEAGDIEAVQSCVNADTVNDTLNKSGWTALSVAVHNQHREMAEYLLQIGADVNATNIKGTSVLMYAKTKLLNQGQGGYDLLDMLVAHGADITHTDVFGKTVVDYTRQAGDEVLAGYFEKQMQKA